MKGGLGTEDQIIDIERKLSIGEDNRKRRSPSDCHAHMPCLDGLRGLAAVMVTLVHGSEFGLPTAIVGLSSAFGVLIFFVLSGFLIGELYLSKPWDVQGVTNYMTARIARIIPIYYLVVIGSFIVYQLFDQDFIYNISAVQLTRLLTFNGSTSVFWSIGPEFQFYFLFIPLWFIYQRVQRKVWFVIILFAISGFCLATASIWPGVVVFSKFHIFACGLICSLVRQHSKTAPRLALIRSAHIVGLTLLILILFRPGFLNLFGATHFNRTTDPAFSSFYANTGRTILAGVLVLTFSFCDRVGALVLANPLALLLGRCSFSIYLLHDAVFYGLAKTGLLAAFGPNFGLMSSLVLVVGISTLAYKFIEAPARGFVKQRLTSTLLRPEARTSPDALIRRPQ